MYRRYENDYDERDESEFEYNAMKNDYTYRLTAKDGRGIAINLKGGNVGVKEYLIKMQLKDGKIIAGIVRGNIDLRKIHSKDKEYINFLANEYFETKSMIEAMQGFGGYIGRVEAKGGKYLINEDGIYKSSLEGQNSTAYANFNEINFDQQGHITSIIDSRNNEEEKM